MMNEGFGKKWIDKILGKVDKDQGVANAGKVLGIGDDGQVVPVVQSGGEGTYSISTLGNHTLPLQNQGAVTIKGVSGTRYLGSYKGPYVFNYLSITATPTDGGSVKLSIGNSLSTGSIVDYGIIFTLSPQGTLIYLNVFIPDSYLEAKGYSALTSVSAIIHPMIIKKE